jgi:C-terminal processing protease CtpA/Prc
MTRDLHAIQYDGHLTLRAPEAAAARSGSPQTPSAPRQYPPAMERAGWISDGIAYVRFNVFLGEPATLEALRAFIAAHRDARTLIVDARTHGGGGLDEMDVIFPELFARATTLVRMDMRESVERRNGPILSNASLVRVDGPAGVIRREHRVTPSANASPLRDARVFVLTSGWTASAAEHFALAIKRTGRATLIGETTAGAGNFGGRIELPGGYSAFVPSGRTFDPDTDKGWDGVGVAPDVATPAAGALTEALVRAGVEPARAAALAEAYKPTGSMERRKPLVRAAARGA